MAHSIRKAFSSQWEDTDQLDRLLGSIAQAGFDGIEPTFNPGAIPSPQSWRDQAEDLKHRCADLGLSIPSMRGGGQFWKSIPAEDAASRRGAVDYAREALDCLAALGGNVLLVVPGMRLPGVTYRDHWQRVLDFARSAGDEAAARGLTIGLENVEARFPLSVRDWRDLLGDIDHPAVRMYLDVGNVVWLDAGYPEHWLRELADHVVQVHFKDAHRGRMLRNLLAGDVNWPAVACALRAIGYDGWVCCEPEWYRHAPWRLPERLARDMDTILDSRNTL